MNRIRDIAGRVYLLVDYTDPRLINKLLGKRFDALWTYRPAR